MLDSSKLEVVRFYPTDVEWGYDYDREAAVTTAPVRRLQQKTQVYPLDIKASARSRLTHSLEVQCRVRSVVMALSERLDFYGEHLFDILSVCETAALIHDVGNPPFGHFGERVISCFMERNLDQIYASSLGPSHVPSAQWTSLLAPDLRHFDGNAQNLRILHSIQKLNLSAQVLGSCIKVPYLAGEDVPEEADDDEEEEELWTGTRGTGLPAGSFRGGKSPFGCFYSESMLFQFIREALEMEEGERFELSHILEYADNISYALADIEDSWERGLVSLDDLQRDLIPYCGEAAESLARELISQCREEGCSFTELVRTRCLPRAIDSFAAFFASYFDAESNEAGYDQEDYLSFVSRDQENRLLQAMALYAREKIFRKREIESLELTGHSALHGLLKIYGRLLALPRRDFEILLAGGELADPVLSRLVHRISRRVMETYVESVADSDLIFADKDERELYFRIRLIIDYITGMTDTYIQAEFSNLRGFTY